MVGAVDEEVPKPDNSHPAVSVGEDFVRVDLLVRDQLVDFASFYLHLLFEEVLVESVLSALLVRHIVILLPQVLLHDVRLDVVFEVIIVPLVWIHF